MLCILCIFLYVAVVFLLYPSGQGQKTSRDNPEPVRRSDNSDIMGKSTFNVNAELQRMRQQKEEKARKEAIAKGEMTEDGREIAQPVNPEDCEVEQKKVWAQVPTEQLDDIFSEPDDDNEPQAEGLTINDIDLAFNTARKQNPTKEEVRHAADTFAKLNDTVLMDDVKKLLPEVNSDIDRVMKMYSAELKDARTVKAPKKVSRSLKPMDFPKRFEDFKASDIL